VPPLPKSERIKRHIKKHPVAYSVGVVVVVAGVSYCLGTRVGSSRILSNSASFTICSPQTINTITTQLERRGHPGKIIKCKETGEVFASISRGADLMGVNRSNLSSHLSGRVPHVGGHTFELLGEAI
jgi:hypothetical protein